MSKLTLGLFDGERAKMIIGTEQLWEQYFLSVLRVKWPHLGKSNLPREYV